MKYTENIIQKEDKTMLNIIAANLNSEELNSASLHGYF